MKITDSILSNSLLEIVRAYLRNNEIDFNTEINENKTLILHINPENTNIIMHDKGIYNGFISKKN